MYVNPNLSLHPTPTTFPLGIHPFVLYICLYFCFANRFICTIFLDSTYVIYDICLCLTPLSMIISRSTYVAANGIISFFFMAELYIYRHTHIRTISFVFFFCFFWIFEFCFIYFLYSTFLLVIYFIHISVYMSIPISQ